MRNAHQQLTIFLRHSSAASIPRLEEVPKQEAPEILRLNYTSRSPPSSSYYIKVSHLRASFSVITTCTPIHCENFYFLVVYTIWSSNWKHSCFFVKRGETFEIGKGSNVLAEGNLFKNVKIQHPGDVVTHDGGNSYVPFRPEEASRCTSSLGRPCIANQMVESSTYKFDLNLQAVNSFKASFVFYASVNPRFSDQDLTHEENYFS
jgi:hypothetical protein